MNKWPITTYHVVRVRTCNIPKVREFLSTAKLILAMGNLTPGPMSCDESHQVIWE
jgi:hypothetical protein